MSSMKDIKFWLEFYDHLRSKDGGYDFIRADELREMLRRMGYEVRTEKDKSSAIKIWPKTI